MQGFGQAQHGSACRSKASPAQPSAPQPSTAVAPACLTCKGDGWHHVAAQVDGEDKDGGEGEGEVGGHVEKEGDLHRWVGGWVTVREGRWG